MEMMEFRKIPYVRPSMETMQQALRTAALALQEADSYETAKAAFFALQEQEQKMVTMFSICSVRNTIDTTDPYFDADSAAKDVRASACQKPVQAAV